MKSEPRIQDFHDVMQELVDAGWSEWNNDIDRSMAETTVCPIDDQPRTYKGFSREDERGYFHRRGFAVCPEGHAEEF
ncbi:MAG: hypothetical protein M3O91_03865 [Chloroflexota bacterium]|nr:hypothetical protein [Chloroflexota bacterium]